MVYIFHRNGIQHFFMRYVMQQFNQIEPTHLLNLNVLCEIHMYINNFRGSEFLYEIYQLSLFHKRKVILDFN